jgi:hypothetical protein
MSRSYFEEVQRFRDNRWVWVMVIAIALAALLPLAYGLYWQLGKGQPWGEQAMANGELIALFFFVLLMAALVTFMLLSIKLELRIDEDGVHYKFFPVKNKWQLITTDQIAEYSFEKRYRFFAMAGIGHHRNLLTKTRSFRVRGSDHLFLKLRNGEKLLLGTHDLGNVEWAMKKLMTKNQ